MGAASYIGRVGGLALALGVGTAIAMGNGVAAADTTDSSPSPSADSSTTNTTSGPASVHPSTPPDTAGSPTPTADKTPTTSNASPTSDASPGTVGTPGTVKPGQVSAQTNTGAIGTSEPTPADQPPGPEPESAEEISATATEEPEPSGTDEPTKATEVPDSDPEVDEEETVAVVDTQGSTHDSASLTVAQSGTTSMARTAQSLPDPASTNRKIDDVVSFVDARALAAAGPVNLSPMMAARTAQDIDISTATPAPAAAPDLLTAAVGLVSSVVKFVLNPLAGNAPTEPAAPPLIWSLLAFARREFDNFFNALAGRPAANVTLAAPQPTMALALAAPPPVNPSASTSFVDWVTGNHPLNDTQDIYGVTGTDVGVMWDNGMVDNPATTDVNEHQILMAFGDTFGIRGLPGGSTDHWRPNILFRSDDATLANGITLTDPEWFTGSDFGGSPLTYVPKNAPYKYFARQIIFPEGLPAGVTLIPTAGISVPTPGTDYNVTQYISFMSVTQWGSPGHWTTNYSAIAYSEDNGEVWTVAPQTVRYNQSWTGNQNFQQSAFVRPGDGYVYSYGTPNGRQGAAYVSRVPERDILNLSKYEYYSKGTPGGWFGIGATPAGWYRNNPAAATPVFGQDTGACGVANAGNRVSEMSVQYNKSLKKYVVLYADQFNNIVMRTADRPEGTWSTAKVLLPQQSGGIYAPMMHPWSPSTMGTGTDLYWNLSLWSDYNVMLMRTDLTKV